MSEEAWEATWTLLTAPFPLLLIGLAVGATLTAAYFERRR